MTQEEKDLLFRDLCARFPYGVILKVPMDARGHFADKKLTKILTEKGQSFVYALMKETDEDSADILSGFYIEHVKPYLRPMSNMTEDEIKEFILIADTVLWLGDKRSTCILSLKQMDWLNAHHFDYRGLIPKGLALEAPEEMYET